MSVKTMETNRAPNGAAKNPNQALWEKGDFTEIAAFMRQSGEAVVESLRLIPPLRALDLGADVTGVDIARNLVEAGNKRAVEAGLDRLKCHEGDACNLEGVADDSFELTLSVFGAMFAPAGCHESSAKLRDRKPSLFNTFEIFDHTGLPFDSPTASRGCLPEQTSRARIISNLRVGFL